MIPGSPYYDPIGRFYYGGLLRKDTHQCCI